MARALFLLVGLLGAVLGAGCGVLPDTRPDWVGPSLFERMADECKGHVIQTGVWSHCDAKVRPWGQGMWQ